MKKFTLTVLMALGLWFLLPVSSQAGVHFGVYVGAPVAPYYPANVYYGGPYYGDRYYYPRHYYGRHYYGGHYGHYGRHWH